MPEAAPSSFKKPEAYKNVNSSTFSKMLKPATASSPLLSTESSNYPYCTIS